MKKRIRLQRKILRLFKKANVPRYLHRYGPKKYTSWFLLKFLLLRELFKLSYRQLVLLGDFLRVKEFPHYTTFQKLARRLPRAIWLVLLRESARLQTCTVASIDATGLSRTNPSLHYLKRIDKDYPIQQSLKLSIMTDNTTKRILSARLRAKPAHDLKDVTYLIKKSPIKPDTCLFDKGYDAEWLHEFLFWNKIKAIIPARYKNVPKYRTKGFFRKKMKKQFDQQLYNKRNLVESVISAIKRKYKSSVSSKHIKTQTAQVYARLILHNLSLTLTRLFLQSPLKDKEFKPFKNSICNEIH